MHNGEDYHDEEHEQRVEDVQEHLVRDEVSIIAWRLGQWMDLL